MRAQQSRRERAASAAYLIDFVGAVLHVREAQGNLAPGEQAKSAANPEDAVVTVRLQIRRVLGTVEVRLGGVVERALCLGQVAWLGVEAVDEGAAAKRAGSRAGGGTESVHRDFCACGRAGEGYVRQRRNAATRAGTKNPRTGESDRRACEVRPTDGAEAVK